MFRNWDFERSVLAVMVVLILTGVGFIFWQRSVAESLSSRLGAAEAKLTRIGERAQQVLDLQAEKADDIVASGKVGPFAYIEQQMTASRIGKKFNTQPPQPETHAAQGYQDDSYALVVAQADYDFDRRTIANFLLYLEGNTTRMKVTQITLDLSQRRGADKDTWKPRLRVTDRHPLTVAP